MIESFTIDRPTRIALMGGAYGNVPALEAAVADAKLKGCSVMVFLGDAIGFCGHSDEVLERVWAYFDVFIAGNLELQAAAGMETCGCGYAAEQDERMGRLAMAHALRSLSEPMRKRLSGLADKGILRVGEEKIVLCHGSPERINEFLYESELEMERLQGWLHRYDARGLACTHTGLPWVVFTEAGAAFAVNCGAVGLPDDDGDPAVHYALVAFDKEEPKVSIERVVYDVDSWARRLEAERMETAFVESLRSGWCSCGLASLPPREREHAERRRGRIPRREAQ